MAELERFEVKYLSHGFHVYRDIWKQKLSQVLEVFHKQGNVHDPFAMAFKVKSAAMLTKAVIGPYTKINFLVLLIFYGLRRSLRDLS